MSKQMNEMMSEFFTFQERGVDSNPGHGIFLR
jgi:hypothetical protein